MYYIIDKELDVVAAEFEGLYDEALSYAASLLRVPSGEHISDYADVLTPEEYAEEYGDEEGDEETEALVRRMCELAAKVESELYADD